jgi:hypothetical protein
MVSPQARSKGTCMIPLQIRQLINLLNFIIANYMPRIFEKHFLISLTAEVYRSYVMKKIIIKKSGEVFITLYRKNFLEMFRYVSYRFNSVLFV